MPPCQHCTDKPKPYPRTPKRRGMVDEREALAEIAQTALALHEDAFHYFDFPARTEDEIENSVVVAMSYHRKMKRLKELVEGLHFDAGCLPAKPCNR